MKLRQAVSGFVIFAVLFLASCGAKQQGEPCDVSGDECDEGLSCLEGVCLRTSSKGLYDVCTVSEECVAGICASGHCTQTCEQYTSKNLYRVGECVNDGNFVNCSVQGVGCCRITFVNSAFSTTQDRVVGYCSAQ